MTLNLCLHNAVLILRAHNSLVFIINFSYCTFPVIRGEPNPIIVRLQVSVPLISRPVANYGEGGTTPYDMESGLVS